MSKHKSKRAFRPSSPPPSPRYPLLDEFDGNRRAFLAKLGAALVGAGALAAGIAACGDRAVGDEAEDEPGFPDMGGAPAMDGRIDQAPVPRYPDMGAAPMPDTRVDQAPLPHHPDMGTMPAPDALADPPGWDADPGAPDGGV